MKESDVSTYFSTSIEFKLCQSAMTRKCQQIDYCLVVMIKGIANFGNTVLGWYTVGLCQSGQSLSRASSITRSGFMQPGYARYNEVDL